MSHDENAKRTEGRENKESFGDKLRKISEKNAVEMSGERYFRKTLEEEWKSIQKMALEAAEEGLYSIIYNFNKLNCDMLTQYFSRIEEFLYKQGFSEVYINKYEEAFCRLDW